jgi:LPS export ABC transporter protein LptC
VFATLVISLLFIYFFSPKPKGNLLSTDVLPEIIFTDFSFNRLNRDGLIMEVDSNRSQKMRDEYQFFNAKLSRKNDRAEIEQINADKISWKQNISIKLTNNVRYANENGLQIYGKDMLYDINTSKLSSDGKFTLISKNAVFIGSGFDYFYKKEKFTSTNIKAIIKGAM